MTDRKVVVTGMGVVSPLGCDLQKFWERLLAGHCGIRRIQTFDPSAYSAQIAGEVVEFDPNPYISKKEQRRMDPFSLYGVVAAKLALADSGLVLDQVNRERAGVVVGSGIGGLQICYEQSRNLVERGPGRFSPFMIPQMIVNILSGQIGIEFGFQGPNFCVVSACATATHCLGESLRIIQHNEADIMIAGGAEGSICELALGGFAAMRALSTRNDSPATASRPFDKDRDGFVMGEGAGILVLEELEHAKKRGARIYCELAGYGRTCDAYHITAPAEGGVHAARGMSLAMQDAGLTPADIDYINAHGTSTPLNDKGETQAIKTALGEARARQIMISSTKSMHGHLLGAAGGVESIACALALKNGAIPPTINYTTPDPECDLDYVPNQARQAKVRACLNNSLGFGGHNATLCFKAV